MKAKEINELGLRNLPVAVSSLTIPGWGERWDKFPAQTFHSEHFVIISVSKNGATSYYVSYFVLGKAQQFSCNLPLNFEFVGLKASEAKKMLNQFQTEFVLSTLYQNLGHAFYIGCDPEIFVVDKDTKVIPAFNFLKSKAEKDYGPRPNINTQEKPIYWDGFQAEFETTAKECLAFHTDAVRAGLLGVYERAKRYDKDANLSVIPVHDIPYEMLQVAKKEHVEFGCMPSLNIYGLEGLKVPGREVPYRSAGGHIHFGIGVQNPATISRIVKALDAILGVACVSMFAKFDHPKRRQMYGLAGEYRLPPHGLEYRTLSNAWLSHPIIMHLVFDLSRKALVLGQKDLFNLWKADEKETIDIIQNCDVDGAHKVMERNKVILMKLFKSSYYDDNVAEAAYNAFKNGIESVVFNPHDLVGNWNLNGVWREHTEGSSKTFFGVATNMLLKGKKAV